MNGLSRKYRIPNVPGRIPLALCLLILAATFSSPDAAAQDGRSLVREGNDLYEKERYPDAEVEYRKSLEDEGGHRLSGRFNLGDALYRQGRYDEAVEQFQNTLTSAEDDGIRARAYHNMGNAYLKGGKLEESIRSYKDALRLNPSDDDTRYNLEYARRLLRQQEQQQQQQQKDQQEKKENEDQKDQKDGGQGDQEKKQQQQQRDREDKRDQPKDQEQQADNTKQQNRPSPDEKKQEEQGEAQERKDRISRADAERILEALKKQEQDVMKKLQKKVPVRINVDKDW